jgi:5-methyltetrahydrofolate--homocysteine methyltransferase
VSSVEAILPRLEAGRPILLGGDPSASLRERGVVVDAPGALGKLVRETPEAVLELYAREVEAGVDVLAAVTSATTPRALAQVGMAFRAAALTGTAIDLAHEVAQQAPRRVGVAGVLGSVIAPQADRVAEEYATHAARLAAAGCEIVLARAHDGDPEERRRSRKAAVESARATALPTWVVVEVDPSGATTRDGEALETCAEALVRAGASVLLLEVASAAAALEALRRAASAGAKLGVLLAATPGQDEEAWAAELCGLIDHGARVVGGGEGTTVRHAAALAGALGSPHASSAARVGP